MIPSFMHRAICLLACALGLFTVPTYAAEEESNPPGALSDDQLREQGFSPLTDNESLEAWNLQPWHRGHWVLRDGVIDYDGRAEHKQFQENTLWTKADYGDVQCYVQWRLPAKPAMKPHPIVLFDSDFLLDERGQRVTRPRLDAGDSGVLLRGKLDCQANIWSQELGSGEINGYRTNRSQPQEVRRACIPMQVADRPLGEWNVFLITLKGDQMTVDLNGVRVIDAARLPALPARGPIGLQHHGDPVQFRELWVKPLE
jgi:hypothetical protein